MANWPRKSADKKPRNVLNNQDNFSIAQGQLFNTLSSKYPDKNWLEVIEAAEADIDSWAENWFLTQLNTSTPLNYSFLSNEGFTLEELENLNLASIPWVEDSDTLRLEIESAIVKFIKHEFSNWLRNQNWNNNGHQNWNQSEVWKKFNAAVRYHNDSLKELLATIRYFPDQLNVADEKKEFLKFREDFTVSFESIKNNLNPIMDLSTNTNINENLDTKNFSDWTDSQQKNFDYLFTKLILWRLKERVKYAWETVENITSAFSIPLSLSTIVKKYPFESYEELLNYASDEEKEQFKELNKQINETEDENERATLEASRDEFYWKCYLEYIHNNDPQLAEILADLYANNFDFSTLNQNPASRDYLLSELANYRFNQLKEWDTLEVFWNNQTDFERYFKDLFDFSKNEIIVNWKTLHIEKELLWGQNAQLKDLWEFESSKGLPIKFTISWFENLGLSLEDQAVFDKFFAQDIENWEIVLENNRVWKLLVLYLMGNPSFLERYDPESDSAKKLNTLLKDINKDEIIEKKKKELDEEDSDEENENNDQSQQDWDEAVNEEDEKAKFLKSWKEVRGDSDESEDGGFRHWAALYVPFWESTLPPHQEDSHEWMKLSISNVDWESKTVRFKANWVELKLPSDYENKVFEFPLDMFEERFIKGENLVGKPYKILGEKKDLQTTFNEMITNGLCNWETLWDTQFEDWNLMMSDINSDGKEVHEKVCYFWSWLNVSDKNKVLYAVKWNNDHTVTLTSDSFLWADNKAYNYEKTMSYPEFLLFIHEKWLSPKTKTMAEGEQVKIKDVVSHRTNKIQWVSIASLMYSIKNIWKKINDGFDAYQKEQNEACLDLLTNKLGIYKKLDKWIGWTSPALSASLTKLHDEAVSWADKKVWKGIDEWIGIFKGLDDYATLFETGADKPSNQRIWRLDKALWKHGTLKNVLITRTCVRDNPALRPIMAAAMISNLKMWKGLYRWMAEYDNQGLWVQCLLGPEHYQRYLQQKKKLEADIKRGGPNATQLRDLLVKSEISYIVYNIQNSHGKDEYFGSVSDSNNQALKQLYSNEFANQLDGAASEIMGQGAVDNGYSKMKKFNTFNPVYEEFKKNIKSWRIEAGLGALMRMWELAVEPSDHTQLKVAISYVTLSGILSKYADKNMITWFDGIARAYMLPTGFFAGKNFHQKYAWHLLGKASKVSDWNIVNLGFTDYMKGKGLTLEKFSKASDNVPYWTLLSELEKWWSQNSKDLDDYFLSLKTRNLWGDPILEQIADVLWEKNPDNVNDSWKSKPKIAWHYGLNQTPDIISRYKRYGKDWFEAKDSDERNDKIAFWEKMLKDLKNLENNPDVKPEFFLQEFKNFFYNDWFWDRNDAWNIARIRLIKRIMQQQWEPMVFTDTRWENPVKIMSEKTYGSKEVKSLIWYLFTGNVLSNWPCQPPEQFEKVLAFFQGYFERHFDEISKESVLRKVFSSVPKHQKIDDEYLIPWDEYTKFIQKEEKYLQRPEDDEVSWTGILDPVNAKKWKRSNYKTDYFVNNELVSMEKQLKRIWVQPPVNLSKPETGGIKIVPHKAKRVHMPRRTSTPVRRAA